jgi:prepilin-type N-terminal cleavage/methylation domain-containing protein
MNDMHIKNKNKAFSLVELSIVLIIIGLLVSGVVAGQSLIQQARLRAVITEFMEIERSVKIFKVAYDYLPGDYPFAGGVWGAECGGNSPAAAGCNGDGNGVVGSYGNGTFPRLSTSETFRFWQHLQLANIMDRSFTGVHGYTQTGAPWHNEDNVFTSKAFKGILFYLDDVTRWNNPVWGKQNIWIMSNAAYFWENDAQIAFSAREASYIDKKIDDSYPRSGSLNASAIYIAGGIGYGHSYACWAGSGKGYFRLDLNDADTACRLQLSTKNFFY